MLIGVPAFAVIYTLFGNAVNEKLQKKNMSTNTNDYRSPADAEFELLDYNKNQPAEKKDGMINKITVILKKKTDKDSKNDKKTDS